MLREVNTHIERFTGLSFQWLRFAPLLEDRFEADTAPTRSKRLVVEGLIAIALYDLFLFADRLVYAPGFHLALIIRLLFVTPLALAVNFHMWRVPHGRFRESGIAGVTCLAGLTHLYLEGNISAVNSAYAQVGLLTVIVYANTSVRLRFPYALATSTVLIFGDIAFLRQDTLLMPRQKFVGLILTLMTVTVTLIANYSTNREDRLNYLLGLRGDLLVRDLSHSNERLADVAETDALTGLANRAGFDARFKQVWKESLEKQTQFSIIMADVDRFKQTNDNYGHLYGDKVLKRIANLVLEALRKEADHAARFGGEEFIILLPDTDEPSAMLVAERLRRLVEVAGFPPIELSRLSFGPITATVSCGVATTVPVSFEERYQLVNAADGALYKAKEAGRNRICSATYEARALRLESEAPPESAATVPLVERIS